MAYQCFDPRDHNGEPRHALQHGFSGGGRADGSYPTRMIHRLGIDESSMGGAMSAYWFMHDAAALPSLGAKPRTLP
jgi:hypothetical protein